MSVKILGGKFKGLPLKVLDSHSVRPTSVMLRRKFFDSFQDWEGIIFCDFFAGTGAMGFEALSRGAEAIFLNDKNRKCVELLEEAKSAILNRTKLPKEAIEISSIDGLKKMKNLNEALSSDQTYCFFVDPPYDHQKSYQLFFDFFKKLQGEGEYFVVIEGEKGRGLDLAVWQEEYEKGRILWHGDHYLFMTWL